jgi:ubiquinone/menaquinone biosynthesis C-methylase UbiE
MSNQTQVNEHYGTGGIINRITSGLKEAGKNTEELQVNDLAPVDEFHTRGRESTLEVAELAKVRSEDLVLDVGCGLGGTARYLAESFGCTVHGIDLTDEYIAVGKELTERVGLKELVHLRQASALELPFEDETFDVIWTEHVQMNIEDKARFYSEIARVLKKGGRFVFHDIFQGAGDAPFYPVPWAETSSLSFLATENDARGLIKSTGLQMGEWENKDEVSLEFFKQVVQRIQEEGTPPVGIHLLMGENAAEKIKNYVCNLTEKRTAVAMGVAMKP